MQKGTILTNKNGDKRKILEVLGDLYFMFLEDDYVEHAVGYTKEQLETLGYTIPKEEWKIKKHDTYWFIGAGGDVYDAIWDNFDVDIKRKNFLGIFKSQQEAQEALSKIKAMLPMK